jgi:hypothetical protein
MKKAECIAEALKIDDYTNERASVVNKNPHSKLRGINFNKA